jgi:hypothetical protein
MDNQESRIQPAYINQMMDGVEPYNSVSHTEVRAITPMHNQPGTQLAPPSGIEYVHPYDTCHTIRPDSTRCGAPRAKGTDFCIGHIRAMEKAAALAENKSE